MPESMAARQSGSSLERPRRTDLFPGLAEQLEQGLVLGSHLVPDVLLQVGGERRAATVGADGDHDIPAPDDRHEGERAVRGVVGRVHEDPPGLAGLEHGPVHLGDVGGGDDEPGAVEVGRGRTGARARVEPAGVGPRPDLVAHSRGDDVRRRHRRRAATRSCGRRSARPRRRRSAGPRRAGSPGTPPATAARLPRASSVPLRNPLTTSFCVPGALGMRLVEGQDLQLDREVDLAQRDRLRDRDHRRREVEDRADARRRRGGRRRPGPRRPASR